MANANINPWTNKLREHPMASAFVVSALIHALLFWLGNLAVSAHWFRSPADLLLSDPATTLASSTEPEPPKTIPLTFVEVDPATATEAPPEDTEFYGAANSIASNPDPAPEADSPDKPEIDGTEERMIRFADQDRPNPVPLQPAEAAAEPEPETAPQEPEPAAPPASNPPPGHQVQSKPDPLTKPENSIANILASVPPPPEKKERPRTLAMARNQENQRPGRKTKLEGGVRAPGRVALNVKVTPFGSYDRMFILAVEKRWFDLLDSTSFAQRSGKVVISFRLNSDGTITQIETLENEVGDILSLLCQRAILDPAPYAEWPRDMRAAIGASYRDVTFTFYYN